MAINKIPELMTDMRAYLNGADDMISVKEVELPELKSLTTEITGIGVAGKIDAPVHGHFDSMESTLKWQIPTKTSSSLFGGKEVHIDIYGDIQGFDDGASNPYTHEQYHVVMRGRVKSHKPGTIKASDAMESETTIEVHYLKLECEGSVRAEVDKYAYKAIIDGIDVLAPIRRNIGMA